MIENIGQYIQYIGISVFGMFLLPFFIYTIYNSIFLDRMVDEKYMDICIKGMTIGMFVMFVGFFINFIIKEVIHSM